MKPSRAKRKRMRHAREWRKTDFHLRLARIFRKYGQPEADYLVGLVYGRVTGVEYKGKNGARARAAGP
jgi:hypothetical protein